MAGVARIYLDGAAGGPGVYGPWMGHVLEEPGCMWLARTREEAVAGAPEAIAAFYAWLRVHGEPDAGRPSRVGPQTGTAPQTGTGPETEAGARIEVAEVQAIPDFGQSGAAVGLFPWDLEPATDADIATCVRRLGYARRDLLETVAELPPEVLDWRPPGNKRTIRENLVHVRNAQGFYLTRVLGWDAAARILPEPWPEDLFFSLNWVIRRAVAALVDLSPTLRRGVVRAQEPDEDWTARKMLRRFVEHEREHVEVVRRTIAAWRAAGGAG